jgi:glutathione synthase
MKTLFVMDPLDRLNLAGDSTYMLMREATDRGWPTWWCTPEALYAMGGQAFARAEAVRTMPRTFHVGETTDKALGAFDVVWMRKDPPFDMAYIFSTYLLEMAPPSTRVWNAPASIRSHNEKLFALTFPGLCAETLVSRDARRIRAFAAALPDRVVLKPWDGNGGRGVLVSRADDPNLPAMIEVLTDEGRRCILAQRHLPEIALGDKRVLLVDGEPVGAMLRVPSQGDHRGNMHVGAKVIPATLTPRDREICAQIGPSLREKGLLFTGIDIIGGFCTEINVTSPTGIQEINRLDGVRIEALVADAVARRT